MAEIAKEIALGAGGKVASNEFGKVVETVKGTHAAGASIDIAPNAGPAGKAFALPFNTVANVGAGTVQTVQHQIGVASGYGAPTPAPTAPTPTNVYVVAAPGTSYTITHPVTGQPVAVRQA